VVPFDNRPWRIRPSQPSDGPALARLESDHPDSGAFGLSFRYRVDALEAQQALRPGSICEVAEVAATGELWGMGFAVPSRCRFEGKERTVALIYGLVVHEKARRQGIATALYQGLVDRIRATDPDAVLVAGIQESNEGSLKAARKWAGQAIPGRNTLFLAPSRRKAPRGPVGLTVRPAVPSDGAAIVAGFHAFSAGFQLAPVFDADAWRSAYFAQPFGEPLRGYLVAVDATGTLVAGLGVLFDGLVETGHFQRIPWFLRFLNLFLRLLPADGVMRRLVGRDAWFSQGHPLGAEGLKAVWHDATWRWRGVGNSLTFFTDGLGALAKVLPKTPWMPDAGGWLMVSSDPPLDLGKAIWLPL